MRNSVTKICNFVFSLLLLTLPLVNQFLFDVHFSYFPISISFNSFTTTWFIKSIFAVKIHIFVQSRSLKSGYMPSTSSNISTPAVFTSNPPLSLPLASADCSRRPSSCNLGVALTSHTHSPSQTRPTTAMTMVDNQPLVVLRKQDLDDFLKEQSISRLESRLDNVRSRSRRTENRIENVVCDWRGLIVNCS